MNRLLTLIALVFIYAVLFAVCQENNCSLGIYLMPIIVIVVFFGGLLIVYYIAKWWTQDGWLIDWFGWFKKLFRCKK